MIVLANTLSAVAMVLGTLLNLYFWIVVIAAVITWVRPAPSNPGEPSWTSMNSTFWKSTPPRTPS